MQWPKNKNDADSEQQFHRLEAGVPGQSSSMSSWSSSASVPTRVREPPPSPQCLPAGVSVPLPAPSQGPSQPSLAQPFSESGTWSLLSLPCGPRPGEALISWWLETGTTLPFDWRLWVRLRPGPTPAASTCKGGSSVPLSLWQSSQVSRWDKTGRAGGLGKDWASPPHDASPLGTLVRAAPLASSFLAPI